MYDGFISRHLNRRLSRPLARLLGPTPVTPNHVSVASLGLALACFVSFAYDYYIAGALLAQASSIADGVDGDLARLKRMTTAFGGFMDAILDRYADSLILLGLTIWAAGDSGTFVWIVGFWAMAGTFIVTYTRARIDSPVSRPFDRGITSAASRDVRLFVVMVGALTGQGLVTLIVLALLSNGVVALRLQAAHSLLQGDHSPVRERGNEQVAPKRVLKKVLIWIGAVLGGLVGLLIVVIVVLAVLGTVLRVNKTYDIEVAAVEVPTDAQSIARGRHIVESYALCVGCHGQDMAGEVIKEIPLLGTFAPPNLTPGRGGLGGKLSDIDYVRAMRHGVGRDGKGLFVMPSQYYNELSDEDLGAIIAYLKNLPPVDNEAELKLGPGYRIIALFEPDFFPARLIDHDAVRPPSPAPGVTAEYGEYLTFMCTVCHGENFSGGTVSGDPGAHHAPDLTSLTQAQWSEADFFKVMRTGVDRSGREIHPEHMPWDHFAKMTDDELEALWLFLSSLGAEESDKEPPEHDH